MEDKIKVFKALLYTVRLSASFGATALVFAAYYPIEQQWNRVFPLVVAVTLGSFYCFLMNDIFDRKKDLLNKKARPIATGLIPLRVAYLAAFVCAGGYIFLSYWYFNQSVFFFSLGLVLVASVYSGINQLHGFSANMIVATLAGATQWLICLIEMDQQLILSGLFIFMISVPREILLDWLDKKGDQAVGKSSVPLSLSSRQNQAVLIAFLVGATGSLAYWMLFFEIAEFAQLLLLLTSVSAWLSFFPFLKKASDREALLSVRLSHVTFAFLILALLSR